VYVTHGDVPWVAAVLAGLSWAVVGIVAGAVVRIAGRAIRNRVEIAVAIAAFLALYLFAVPFPLVVLGAGAIGLVAGSRFPSVLPDDGASEPAQVQEPARVEPSWRRAVRVLAVGLTVWLGPLALVVVAAGTESVLAQEAVFFSVMALVTFGGAYAVLAYVNQAAVTRFGWLTSDEMAVGLSLAETTPGPLILTVVFVGFVAAYRSPGSLEPVAAGIAGALVTAWATFVPSFVWIFLGAPSVERLRGNRRLSSGLAAITASVVGVIANLGLVFAVSVLFEETTTVPFLGHDLMVPVAGSLDPLALAVAAASFVAVWRLRANVVWIVLGAGVVGWARLVLG
jgi:chromate transporter